MSKQELRIRIDIVLPISGDDAFQQAAKITTVNDVITGMLMSETFKGGEHNVQAAVVKPRKKDGEPEPEKEPDLLASTGATVTGIGGPTIVASIGDFGRNQNEPQEGDDDYVPPALRREA
jgi:hypothetical protein